MIRCDKHGTKLCDGDIIDLTCYGDEGKWLARARTVGAEDKCCRFVSLDLVIMPGRPVHWAIWDWTPEFEIVSSGG